MEKEFTQWFKANEKRFAHGQFDEKQVAYSAWLEGRNQALTIPAVVGRSEQLTCKHENIIMNSATTGYCDDCKNSIDFLAV